MPRPTGCSAVLSTEVTFLATPVCGRNTVDMWSSGPALEFRACIPWVRPLYHLTGTLSLLANRCACDA
jgi:hypothetical protein